MIQSLVVLVLYIIIIGVVIYLLRYLVATIPMDEAVRNVANIVITVVGILIVILLLLNFAGLIDGGLPRLR